MLVLYRAHLAVHGVTSSKSHCTPDLDVGSIALLQYVWVRDSVRTQPASMNSQRLTLAYLGSDTVPHGLRCSRARLHSSGGVRA
jgi:hypothetical protein